MFQTSGLWFPGIRNQSTTSVHKASNESSSSHARGPTSPTSGFSLASPLPSKPPRVSADEGLRPAAAQAVRCGNRVEILPQNIRADRPVRSLPSLCVNKDNTLPGEVIRLPPMVGHPPVIC